MPQRRAHLSPQSSRGQLAAALTALRVEYEVPEEFPENVLDEASAVIATGVPLPDLDLTDIPFVTLDPEGSMDLDQAYHLEQHEGGFTLRYAIADVPSFVRAGGAIDAEARLRGQTLYLPDGTVPLHPRPLSEDQVSLLPDEERTAFVWTIPVDADGAAAFEGAAVDPARVERARVRSRKRYAYESAQADIDAGTADDELTLLQTFGLLRIAQERKRGGASLNMPDEEVVRDDDGYRIERRFPLAIEDWNAQLSLLTGMVAGHIMLEGGIGILRTMPAPDEQALTEFRTRVAALGLPWSGDIPYGEYLASVPRGTPVSIAVLHAASSLFRGAGYSAFGVTDAEGTELTIDGDPAQAAIAAPYAHVTAPLRRLVDRWGLVICEALCSGQSIPEWIRDSLAELPELMRASASKAGRLSGEALNRVEAALLRDRVGDALTAIVIEASGERVRVQVEDPPVSAHARVATGATPPEASAAVTVTVLKADVPSGTVDLEHGHGS